MNGSHMQRTRNGCPPVGVPSQYISQNAWIAGRLPIFLAPAYPAKCDKPSGCRASKCVRYNETPLQLDVSGTSLASSRGGRAASATGSR